MKKVGQKLYESFFYFCSKLGCHQIPNRSFYVKGYQMPFCARCTGVLNGYLIGLILETFISMPIWLVIASLLPMGIDWCLQTVFKKDSTNNRRFLSGVLGGIGIINFFYKLFGL